LKYLPDPPFPSAIIVMTDGVDTVSRKATYESSLTVAERSRVPIFPIYFDTYAANQKGLTSAFSQLTGILVPPPAGTRGSTKEDYELARYYLSDLTALSGGHAVLADQVIAGKTLSYDIIPDELRSQYLITVSPPTSQPGTRHQIRVRIDRPGLTVLSKSTYLE
jgi:hypothetical protein